MKFDVYCDESNPEVLKDKSANKFLVLGSIWLPTVNETNNLEKILKSPDWVNLNIVDKGLK